jgi:hypothetical protein
MIAPSSEQGNRMLVERARKLHLAPLAGEVGAKRRVRGPLHEP